MRPKASPEQVRVHDFIDRQLGRAVPYGIYDIAENKGWVSVGVDHDTAAFAVNTIRRWWSTMGQERYPNAKRLMITADGGGSNGARVRLWKIELQKFVDEIGIPVMVCHLPPGTSKWNKACPRAGGDRAPPVRVHHQELARQTTRQSPDNCSADRRDDDPEGPCSPR